MNKILDAEEVALLRFALMEVSYSKEEGIKKKTRKMCDELWSRLLGVDKMLIADEGKKGD